MIEYIKEYGVNYFDFEYILHNVKTDIVEIMMLSESNVRKNLAFYNSIGITNNIAKIIVSRPDLIINENQVLIDLISKIDQKLFVNIVDKSIDDLIILGV